MIFLSLDDFHPDANNQLAAQYLNWGGIHQMSSEALYSLNLPWLS